MFKTPITKILKVRTHPNPEVHSLEIATVYDFDVIIKKNQFKVEDSVLFIPGDTLLPIELEEKVFGKDSKIKLTKGRVRQINIKGFKSFGLILSLDYLPEGYRDLPLETDVSNILDLKKYEPPEIHINTSQTRVGMRRNKLEDHPLFHSYNGLDAIKWYPDAFTNQDLVVIQEKLHGSSCRASLLPFVADTWWKKIQKFFKLNPTHEWNWGSNNVQISKRSEYKGFYGEDIYSQALKKAGAIEKIQPNEIIYGEVIGPKIQANYTYGETEPTFVLFDVKVYNEKGTGEFRWMSPKEVEMYAYQRGFKHVPVLYEGYYNKDLAYSLTKGPSVYCPEQKVREGIVIKDEINYNDPTSHSQRKSLKWISEDYLADKTNTDAH